MENVLFLQSEVVNPYAVYDDMLARHRVYFDRDNNIRAVYGYRECLAVLQSEAAHIPPIHPSPGLSERVITMLQALPRLNNPPVHTALRQVSLDLMQRLHATDTPSLLHDLLGEPGIPATIDWVGEVSKKLPALALLKGAAFSNADIQAILPAMETLTMIMQPVKSYNEAVAISAAVERIYDTLCAHFSSVYGATDSHTAHVRASGFIGLLIQSFDAGRGLLSNALLRLVREGDAYGRDYRFFRQSVLEVLRFDPPVQNTRRVLMQPLQINGQTLEAGDVVLLVLAAANRDPDAPGYISYGAGIHTCVAEHFMTDLVAYALQYIFTSYNHVELLEKQIQYEPRINVRLPVRMNLRMSCQ